MELSRLGKYEIVAKIGQGGMGEVYRAHDPVLGRDVAIKIMSAGGNADQDLRRRFLREAQSAARLNHPNIVTVHDFGEDQGKLFIAMELLEGTDLREVIVHRTPLSLPVKFSLMTQVSEGLAFAHERDIVHRDIKPGNIHVQRNGHIKVMDFGLARGSTSEMTLAGSILGTPNYMAPEQVRGEPATGRSDVFAMGVVFYELLTGRKAFGANSVAGLVYQVMSVEPEPVEAHDPTLTPGLSALVAKAMAKKPAERYADAGELLTALREIETLARSSFDEPISKAPPGWGGPSTPWPVPPRPTPMPIVPQPPTAAIAASPGDGPSETLAGSSLDKTISEAPPSSPAPPTHWPAPPRHPQALVAAPSPTVVVANPAGRPLEALDRTLSVGATLGTARELEALARASLGETIPQGPPQRGGPPTASAVPAPLEKPAPPARTPVAERTRVWEPTPSPRRPAGTSPVPSKRRTAWIATGVAAATVAVVAGVWQMPRPEERVTMTGTEGRVSPIPVTPTATLAPTSTIAPVPTMTAPSVATPAEPAEVTAAVREIKAALSARDEGRATRGLRSLAAVAPGHRELGALSRRATDLNKRVADDARRATERATLDRAPTPLPVAVLTVLPTPATTVATIMSPTPLPMATAMPSSAPPVLPSQGEAAARQAIRGVLDEFRAAFERRDVEALRAVQPDIDYEFMKSTFATVRSYLVRIEVQAVSIQGEVARAKCSVTYSPVPKQAGKQKPVAQIFHLRRRGDLWIIDRIEAE